MLIPAAPRSKGVEVVEAFVTRDAAAAVLKRATTGPRMVMKGINPEIILPAARGRPLEIINRVVRDRDLAGDSGPIETVIVKDSAGSLMAIKLSGTTDKLQAEFDDMELRALQYARLAWGFKDEASALQFAIAILFKAKKNIIEFTDENEKKQKLSPAPALLVENPQIS